MKASSTRDRSRDEADIRAVEQSYDHAWNRADVTALAAHLTEDTVVVNCRFQKICP
jgi:ketosteroid isomerase-like protein